MTARSHFELLDNATVTAFLTAIADGTIPLAKLAALTASRAVVSTAGGVLSAATTTAAEIGFVNGLTSAAQTQLNAKIGAKTDTATIVHTITGGVTLSSDVQRAALFPVTYAANAADQAISAATETDLTSLTGLTLPVTSTVNTRTFEVDASVVVVNTSGTTASDCFLRFWNGANGTKADTPFIDSELILAPNFIGTLTLTAFRFTPANSAHTKFGLSLATTQATTLRGTSRLLGRVLVREVP